MQTLFNFLVAILATTIGGISGVGGGVIIKPVMDAVSGLPVATISFLSGCTVLAMTITSMLRSIGGEVKVEPRRGTLLAIGAAVGGIVGKQLFDVVKDAGGSAVSVAQQVLMIALTLGVLAYTLNRPRIRTLDVKNGAACILIGLYMRGHCITADEVEGDPLAPFSDAADSQAAAVLVSMGIVKGTSPSTLSLQAPLTRGELAVLVSRTLENVPSGGMMPPPGMDPGGMPGGPGGMPGEPGGEGGGNPPPPPN